MNETEIAELAAALREEITLQLQSDIDREEDEYEQILVGDKRRRIDELNEEIAELEAQAVEYQDALQRHDQLRTAIDILDGNITHVVRPRGHAREMIQTLQEVAVHEGRERPTYRMLSITPNQGETNVWQMSTYADGSGSQSEFIPCHSLDEAHRIVNYLFTQALMKARETLANGHDLKLWEFRRFADSGVELEWPPDVSENLNATATAAHAKTVVHAQTELRKAAEAAVYCFPTASETVEA